MVSIRKIPLHTAASAIMVMACLLLPGMCSAQVGEWTWMGGDHEVDAPGVYGDQGDPAPGNMPGARYGSIPWTDSAGNLWLFGGNGFDGIGTTGILNDLWRYDRGTGEWTWVSGSDMPSQLGTYGTFGISAPDNVPGARASSISWLDEFGRLWLFGGDGFDENEGGCADAEAEGDDPFYNACLLNDLWRYDTDTEQWTWISGSNTHSQMGVYVDKGFPNEANIPGARKGSISWMGQDGYMWLFGGFGLGGDCPTLCGLLNDLWSFNRATREWIWVSGADSPDFRGVYGTLGEPGFDNVPGARQNSISWIDKNGMLWLFGGYGLDGRGELGRLNDLWRYDPVEKMWTWMSGSDIHSQIGIYDDTPRVPGCREYSVSWIDEDGMLWLFGGFGLASTFSPFGGRLNDLWRYDPVEDQWDWISGSKLMDQQGVYGTMNILQELHGPGARRDSISWIDEVGNLWLFAGHGFDGDGGYGYLNDLWLYGAVPCTSDADCDDEEFCNGVERCVDGVCVAGTPPCSGDTPVCDEAGEQCVECLADSDCEGDTSFCDLVQNICVACLLDADCDDGLFCNGAETCVDGECAAGTPPCIGDTPVCNEELDTCTAPECLADVDCDDGLFCNGVESCVAGICVAGTPPCSGDTPICDEITDSCLTGCIDDSDCSDAYRCQAGICVPRCWLSIQYKPIYSARLSKPRRVNFRVIGPPGIPINFGPDIEILRTRPNLKRGFVRVRARVPAGLPPQVIMVRVGDCFGQIEIQ